MTRTLLIFATLAVALSGNALQSAVFLESPNRKLSVAVAVDSAANGRLTLKVTRDGHTIVEPSPVGIRVDGVDLGRGVTIDKSDGYRVDEKSPWRGVKSEAVNRANGTRIFLHHAGGQRYTLDVRAFDDGVAFRHEVPGAGRRVPEAGSGFTLPSGSVVWTHGLRGHYEELLHARRLRRAPARDELGAPDRERRDPDVADDGLRRPPRIAALESGCGDHQEPAGDVG